MNPRHVLWKALRTDAPQGLEAGALFAGHHLIEELGRGGMGRVFSACHTATDRLVALKVPPAGADHELVMRFRAEAQAMSALDHPGIVPIYEVGEFDGVPFFTMRLAEGGNVAGQTERFRAAPREAAALMARVADAVQHAHERGLLHRDLKPANILLAAPDEPLVADFGLARWLGSDGGLTVSGALLGTPGYLAPELLENAEATIASDVFSLGAVLYHLLAGRAPYEGASVAKTLARVTINEAAPLPAKVPRDLAAICTKCLAREPACRYATAGNLAADLRRFLDGAPIVARPASPLEKTWRWCRRHPATAVLLVLLATVLVVAFLMIDTARRAEATAHRQIADSLDLSELERAEESFHAGDSVQGLALLARVARRNPTHPTAVQRLASALWHGDFILPLGAPIPVGGKITRLQLLRDGVTLLVVTENDAGLWDAVTGERRLKFEHDGSHIVMSNLSLDERTLIAWDTEPGGTMVTWDVATGRRLLLPEKHEDRMHVVALSPDGKQTLPANDQTIGHLHSTATGVEVGDPLTQTGPVTWSSFSLDGRTIATISGRTLYAWERDPQVLRFAVELPDQDATVMHFSPDSRWLLTVSTSGAMRFFSAKDGHPASVVMRHGGPIHSAFFSADSARLITGSEDHTARVWSVPDGEPLIPPLRHRDAVWRAVFSPDEERIATCSRDNSGRVWDAHTGRPLSQPLLSGEQPGFTTFSHDGAVLYIGGAEQVVQRWDTRPASNASLLLTTHSPLHFADFNADGTLVVTASDDGLATLCDAVGKPVGEPFEHESAILVARFSADGKRLAIGTKSGGAWVHDLSSKTASAVSFEHAGPVLDVCLSADGRRLATAYDDGTARVWQVDSHVPLTPPLVHIRRVVSVRFSPDGRTLLTASEDGTARLWDVTTGQPGHTMRQNDALAGAEFSPDGKLIATASRDNTAQVWDVQTGTSVSPPLPHARTVSAVAFSPDSRRVATASWDCTARLWDVRTGRALTRPMTHDDHINDIQFSPDGRLLATASRDQTARVWDVATGLPITEPLRHSVAVLRARFHPDGHRLLTTAADSARIWEVPDFSGPTPDWLLPVAEMLSLSGHPGTPQDTVPFIERYHDAEVGKPSTSQDNAYARLARHLFGSKLRSQSN